MTSRWLRGHCDGLVPLWFQGRFIYATNALVRRTCVVALAVVFASWPVRAQPSNPPVSLTYDAPWECPDQAQFLRQLRARSTRLNSLGSGELALSIDVRITGAYSRYHGHLTLREAGEESVVERDVGGPNCVDVTAALALVAAVTLDAPRSHAPPDGSAPASQKNSNKRFAAGLVAGLHSAVAPVLVRTFGLSWTFHDRALSGSPQIRVEGLFARSDWRLVQDPRSDEPIGQARFMWLASRVTACPLQVNWSLTTIGPCALLEVGALTGEGKTPSGVESKTGVWLAPGARLDWSVQLEPVWLNLGAGAVFPVRRDKYQFYPNPTVFQPDSLGYIAELELAWAFK